MWCFTAESQALGRLSKVQCHSQLWARGGRSWQPLTGRWASAGRTGDLLEVQQPVDLESLRGKLEGLLSRGIRSLAVVLMHSYT